MKFEAVVGAELMVQPGPRRRDAEPLLQGSQRVLRQSHPIVANLNSEHVVVAPRGDVDVPQPRLPGDAVLDRVLDERLEQQRRHQGLERLPLDVVPDDEAVGKPCPFDVEVLAKEVELGVQRHFLLAETLQREPQQLAEAHERAFGGLHVPMHQSRDRVERVEEKVRVELLAKGLELRLHEPDLELGDVRRVPARFPGVEKGIVQREDDPAPAQAADQCEDSESGYRAPQCRDELPRERSRPEP